MFKLTILYLNTHRRDKRIIYQKFLKVSFTAWVAYCTTLECILPKTHISHYVMVQNSNNLLNALCLFLLSSNPSAAFYTRPFSHVKMSSMLPIPIVCQGLRFVFLLDVWICDLFVVSMIPNLFIWNLYLEAGSER